LFVGARHIQVEPGTYRIVQLSPYARALLEQLGIRKGPGDSLTGQEVDSVLDFYVHLLRAAAAGATEVFQDPVARLHQQVAFRPLAGMEPPILTLSGGIGELVYGYLQGKPWPPTTYYGDLGIDLARRILYCEQWAEDFRRYRPGSAGRATVYGLLRHA